MNATNTIVIVLLLTVLAVSVLAYLKVITLPIPNLSGIIGAASPTPTHTPSQQHTPTPFHTSSHFTPTPFRTPSHATPTPNVPAGKYCIRSAECVLKSYTDTCGRTRGCFNVDYTPPQRTPLPGAQCPPLTIHACNCVQNECRPA